MGVDPVAGAAGKRVFDARGVISMRCLTLLWGNTC